MTFSWVDITIFAVVGAIIAWRLRQALGGQPKMGGVPVVGMSAKNAKKIIEKINRSECARIAVIPLDENSSKMMPLDPGFSTESFLDNAKKSFNRIVACFNQGDKDALENLAMPALIEKLGKEMSRREAEQELVELEILGFEHAKIKDVSVCGNVANVTVEFATRQITATYDGGGGLICGDPDKEHNIVDVWTFTRDYSAKPSFWKLSDSAACLVSREIREIVV
ncbi:MAG: Tim44/TimA family putative adaptor protein [Alphaproteobacteria bacterium]|nr:Tim44/TimA family putative adaptor protein [Alphaproteobacteria bacterium]